MTRQNIADPPERRPDSLDTEDGTLLTAHVQGVTLTRDRAGNVVIIVGPSSALLSPAHVRALTHALSCSITPYGLVGPLAAEITAR